MAAGLFKTPRSTQFLLRPGRIHVRGRRLHRLGGLIRAAFVTAEQWKQLPADDQAAADALASLGIAVDAPIWDDSAIDWTAYDAVILRSPWDYYLREAEFRAWIGRLEALGVPLWNPAPTLRWNLDKIYLRDLEQRGVAITPTAFPADGDRLSDILTTHGWKDAVIKPRISAAGHRTMRIRDTQRGPALAAAQAELDELNRLGGAMVQPYLKVIETVGEWSFVFLGGHFSHAVLKRPGAGEFRVQEQYGGTAAGGHAPAALVDQARLVMAAVNLPWLYARVDGCEVDGRLLLMELELLEPSLFLLDGPGAPEEFARVIAAEMRKKAAESR